MLQKLMIFAFLIGINFAALAETTLAHVDAWRKENNVPGVVLMISTADGHEVVASGTTTLNGKTRVTTSTLFPVGSITKTFMSAMIIKLEGEDKLHLDDRLSKYLPQYPKWKNVTVKQLMNMTSGIPNFSDDDTYKADLENNFQKDWTSNDLIKLAYDMPINAEPGKNWLYSNTNYLLLGEIINKVSGKPVIDVLQERVIDPLDLKQTFYSETSYTQAIRNEMAHGYYNDQDMVTINPSDIGAAGGGMLMSTEDLHNCIEHLFVKQDAMSTDQLDEMLSGVTVPDLPLYPHHTKYGLGVIVSPDKKWGDMIWYTGVSPGYSSTFLYVPKYEILIVAQANLNRKNDVNFNLLFPNQQLIQDILNGMKTQ